VSSLGFNSAYIEDLYQQYQSDPEAVSPSWRSYFDKSAGNPGEKPTSSPSSSAPPPAVKPEATKQKVAPTQAAATPKPAPAPPAAKVVAPKVETSEDGPLAVDTVLMKGASARLVQNMESSLGMPTATSVRHIPVKLMTENRQLINRYNLNAGRSKVSFTHIIAWALVRALKKYPAMNASFRRNEEGKPEHIKPKHINFGLAIDVEKKNGTRALMVPNVKMTDTMNFQEFVGGYNGLVKKTRGGKLEISDFEGTTITLTNPGMIGTVMSVPRLMQGRGLIIAVGSISYPAEYAALPPKELSKLGMSQVMTITSTYDHRVIQGAESGAFLNYVSQLLTGGENFYQEIFDDLGIPTPPLTSSTDTSPLIGQSGNSDNESVIEKQAAVIQLIRAYRVRGPDFVGDLLS